MRSFLFFQNYPVKQSYHCLLSGSVSTVTALLKKGAQFAEEVNRKNEYVNVHTNMKHEEPKMQCKQFRNCSKLGRRDNDRSNQTDDDELRSAYCKIEIR